MSHRHGVKADDGCDYIVVIQTGGKSKVGNVQLQAFAQQIRVIDVLMILLDRHHGWPYKIHNGVTCKHSVACFDSSLVSCVP